MPAARLEEKGRTNEAGAHGRKLRKSAKNTAWFSRLEELFSCDSITLTESQRGSYNFILDFTDI